MANRNGPTIRKRKAEHEPHTKVLSSKNKAFGELLEQKAALRPSR